MTDSNAESNFEGLTPRSCGEHRTVGSRAWCHDCGEWCYSHDGCVGCKCPNGVEAVLDELDELRGAVGDIRRHMSTLHDINASTHRHERPVNASSIDEWIKEAVEILGGVSDV